MCSFKGKVYSIFIDVLGMNTFGIELIHLLIYLCNKPKSVYFLQALRAVTTCGLLHITEKHYTKRFYSSAFDACNIFLFIFLMTKKCLNEK